MRCAVAMYERNVIQRIVTSSSADVLTATTTSKECIARCLFLFGTSVAANSRCIAHHQHQGTTRAPQVVIQARLYSCAGP